ncbi:bifunctional protein FolD 2, partial [Tanacetum coccineum]
YTGGDLEILNDGSDYESRLEEHKYEIVKMVQGRKHVCGMSGDGVNAIDVFVTGVFINPILIEAFGLTLIEDAAYGLPMVAQRIEVVEEQLAAQVKVLNTDTKKKLKVQASDGHELPDHYIGSYSHGTTVITIVIVFLTRSKRKAQSIFPGSSGVVNLAGLPISTRWSPEVICVLLNFALFLLEWIKRHFIDRILRQRDGDVLFHFVAANVSQSQVHNSMFSLYMLHAPRLAVLIVGYRKESQSYVNMKRKVCAEVGINSLT